jgi:hypothetical protein
MHSVLEEYYSTGFDIEAASGLLEQLLEADSAVADEQEADAFAKESDLARAVWEGYIEWVAEEGMDEGLEIVDAERSVQVKVADDIMLVGRLDLLVRQIADGFLRFIDFKNLASLKVPVLHLDEQMLMYMLMLKLSQPDDIVIGAIYRILKKSKRTARANPPFYADEEVLHNEIELRNFYTRLMGVINDIIRTENALNEGADHHYVAYPTPNQDCSWKCEFFSGCHFFDDGSAGEQWLEAAFDRQDPYERRYKDVAAGH